MAAEAARSGRVRTERNLFLTLTGLLMEGVYTQNPEYDVRTILPHLGRVILAARC
jgi:hypothetical protein